MRTTCALALLAGAFGAADAATTGTITLQGTVAQSCNITVTPQTGYNALDLSTSPTSLNVATVNETCNDPKGYTVSMTTANGTTTGVLKGAIAGNPDTVTYNVTYNGSAVTLAGSTATVTNVTAKTAAAGVTKNLNIAYTGNSNLGADTYTDTLTFTITAK
jgi:spore coat protein U-like protein